MLTREEIEEKRESKLGDRPGEKKRKDRSNCKLKACEEDSWDTHNIGQTAQEKDSIESSNRSASVTHVRVQRARNKQRYSIHSTKYIPIQVPAISIPTRSPNS